MAWTNIPNANLAAGAPIRSVDLLAIRDNFSALAYGDTGSPKILGKAIEVAANLPVLTVSAADTYGINTPYVTITTGSSVGGQYATTSTTYVKMLEFTYTKFTGSIRTRTDGFAAESPGYVSIRKNGVQEVEQYYGGSGWTYDVLRDITILPTDVISFWMRSQFSGSFFTAQIGRSFATNTYVNAIPLKPAV